MKALSEITNDYEAFSFVKEMLFEQGYKSVAEDLGCQYRGEEGMKCAVGWLIADELYESFLEDKRADSALVLSKVRESCPNWGMTPQSITMLGLLQDIHDDIEVDSWLPVFEGYASAFDENKSFANNDDTYLLFHNYKYPDDEELD